MKTIIHRVQDRAGRGPYRPGYSYLWCDSTRNLEERPDVFREFGYEIIRQAPRKARLGSGFRSVEGLTWWFSKGELEELDRRGYFPVYMEVDGVLGETSRQLIFYRWLPLGTGYTRLNLV